MLTLQNGNGSQHVIFENQNQEFQRFLINSKQVMIPLMYYNINMIYAFDGSILNRPRSIWYYTPD